MLYLPILIGNGVCAYTLPEPILIYICSTTSTIDINHWYPGYKQNRFTTVLLWWLFLFPYFYPEQVVVAHIEMHSTGVFLPCLRHFIGSMAFCRHVRLGMAYQLDMDGQTSQKYHSTFWSTAGITAMFGCLLFLMPYFAADEQSNQSEALPEVTFFCHLQ